MQQVMNAQVSTMSSREIAELTGKRHDNVKRDIETQLGQLGNVLRFEGVYIAGNGQKRTEYLLPRRECEILITGYDVKRRAAVIDRWFELESRERRVLTPAEQLLEQAQRLVDAERRQREMEAQQAQQQARISHVEERVEAICKPIQGKPIAFVKTKLRKAYGINVSVGVITKVAEYYSEDTGLHKVSKPKANGQFYPEVMVDVEATCDCMVTFWEECEHYDYRSNNRDFYHHETGIGGQYV